MSASGDQKALTLPQLSVAEILSPSVWLTAAPTFAQ
ncbi:hypothetical protein swp_4469 [Shewanella piezotolerans WP3]|uniref:Uncharacterized protein n=1 Tax=Shewanella piezotolerans (strain WP3 / JCM 13877) TaxID=225849 RepID=B8CTK4_SHEPW|nr:hypothetical protein swp_4469 [Shewanella piezotolerans WP3]